MGIVSLYVALSVNGLLLSSSLIGVFRLESIAND